MLRRAYLHSDHLGSASLTTCGNSSGCGIVPLGGVVARQLYDAWGNVRSGGGMPTDIGYTGQRLDATTGGLMFYNARYYSPAIGRFISADTIVPDAGNPQQFNRYTYASNSPIIYNDPSGHCPWCIVGAGIALFLLLSTPSSEPYHPYASAQYRDTIADAAQQHGVPEIALAAAVDLQSWGLVSEPWIYTFDKDGDHSWGVGQIRKGEDRALSGQDHSIEKLQDPGTSIDLLATKMAMAKQNYGKYCDSVCSLPDLYVIYAIGQNSFMGEDSIKSIFSKGINEYLNQDDLAARQSQIDADNAPISFNKLRTQTLTRMWVDTGNSRFQIRTFNARIQQLLQGGYTLPAGYNAAYMECLGQARSACTP